MNIVTNELSRLQRDALQKHFLALNAEDRRLRFGVALSDHGVCDYVTRIDFERDAVYGVFDDDMSLAGVGHLCGLESAFHGRLAQQGVSEPGRGPRT